MSPLPSRNRYSALSPHPCASHPTECEPRNRILGRDVRSWPVMLPYALQHTGHVISPGRFRTLEPKARRVTECERSRAIVKIEFEEERVSYLKVTAGPSGLWRFFYLVHAAVDRSTRLRSEKPTPVHRRSTFVATFRCNRPPSLRSSMASGSRFSGGIASSSTCARAAAPRGG